MNKENTINKFIKEHPNAQVFCSNNCNDDIEMVILVTFADGTEFLFLGENETYNIVSELLSVGSVFEVLYDKKGEKKDEYNY